MKCWEAALYRELVEEHFFATKGEADAFQRQSEAEGHAVVVTESPSYPATNAGLALALNELIERICHNEG